LPAPCHRRPPRQPTRFHLAGHDWSGSLAWHIADQYPDRIASLTMLSRPHPQAFNQAPAMPDGEQKRRSGYHGRFLDLRARPDNLPDDARRLRTRLTANGLRRRKSNSIYRLSAIRRRWR
jgi:pimeloyl-ACP methyl ester carboxylesterase